MTAEASPCRDCGADTTPCTGKRGCRHIGRWEWYMVRNVVWATAGAGEGFLCIGCLERRLGRPLNRMDFPPLPINEPDPWDTQRLAAAKRRPASADAQRAHNTRTRTRVTRR